jgi:putative transposase
MQGQSRFWEHQISDEREYQVYMDYTHFNPVKHRLVEGIVDWPYSTFHRTVRLGIYPDSWGGVADGGSDYGFGE